jgi:hypothetical protein
MTNPEPAQYSPQEPGTPGAGVDDASAALIERELEEQWLAAQPDDDLPGEVEVDLSAVPWEGRDPRV